MLGVEEKDPVIRGKYADDLYDEYKEVYGESIEKGEEVILCTPTMDAGCDFHIVLEY